MYFLLLTLSLFMAGVMRADDTDHAVAFDDLAILASAFD